MYVPNDDVLPGVDDELVDCINYALAGKIKYLYKIPGNIYRARNSYPALEMAPTIIQKQNLICFLLIFKG